MRIGVFLLAARFPGNGDGEVLSATVEAAIAAERAGFDDVWFAEHHFMSYGVCRRPPLSPPMCWDVRTASRWARR
jgi:alkanesulfonate monooxygenase SsuD/methylene tetrahydromethanopterin reductase-like flavin-dependent oxidoreductase (luciferase family)